MGQLVRLAALVAGVSYLWVVASGLAGPPAIAWKGSGVALLAVYAALARQWPIALVMALGAAGDVLLETHGLMVGAIAFALGHVVAIWVYWTNRRAQTSGSQRGLAIATLVLTPLVSFALTGQPDVAFYGLLLGAMAATAWVSRFGRYSVGIGAMAFVASDLLIFARMEALAGQAWVSFAIWLLYFGGQYLIATGVVGLRGAGASARN